MKKIWFLLAAGVILLQVPVFAQGTFGETAKLENSNAKGWLVSLRIGGTISTSESWTGNSVSGGEIGLESAYRVLPKLALGFRNEWETLWEETSLSCGGPGQCTANVVIGWTSLKRWKNSVFARFDPANFGTGVYLDWALGHTWEQRQGARGNPDYYLTPVSKIENVLSLGWRWPVFNGLEIYAEVFSGIKFTPLEQGVLDYGPAGLNTGAGYRFF